MRLIPFYRRDEFASDSEASDATFATPHRVDEAGGKGRKRKPVYAMGRVPDLAREVTQGAEWSGTTMPSMPNVFQSPRQTTEVSKLESKHEDQDLASSPGRGGDPKVRVTLKRVPSSSSPSGSPTSWDIKRIDDELDEEEKPLSTRQPHTAKKAASTKKLDKVVLNLKKTAGNSWNVSSGTSSIVD